MIRSFHARKQLWLLLIQLEQSCQGAHAIPKRAGSVTSKATSCPHTFLLTSQLHYASKFPAFVSNVLKQISAISLDACVLEVIALEDRAEYSWLFQRYQLMPLSWQVQITVITVPTWHPELTNIAASGVQTSRMGGSGFLSCSMPQAAKQPSSQHPNVLVDQKDQRPRPHFLYQSSLDKASVT